jgi:hypothetical protein
MMTSEIRSEYRLILDLSVDSERSDHITITLDSDIKRGIPVFEILYFSICLERLRYNRSECQSFRAVVLNTHESTESNAEAA